MAAETERRAQELGTALLNAARPYMDVNLDRQGLPVAVTPRDFFAFLEALTTYNNRTPAMKDKALVLEGMSPRVIDFCKALPSLRFRLQEEEDDDEQQTLLEYDSDWDPKTEAGREKCLEYDTNIIIPALRKQFTFKNGNLKTEHVQSGARHAQECCAEEGRDGLGTNAYADQGVPRTARARVGGRKLRGG